MIVVAIVAQSLLPKIVYLLLLFTLQAPNLLLTMINMMLKFGASPDPSEEDYGLYFVNEKGDSDFQVINVLLICFSVY